MHEKLAYTVCLYVTAPRPSERSGMGHTKRGGKAMAYPPLFSHGVLFHSMTVWEARLELLPIWSLRMRLGVIAMRVVFNR